MRHGHIAGVGSSGPRAGEAPSRAVRGEGSGPSIRLEASLSKKRLELRDARFGRFGS